MCTSPLVRFRAKYQTPDTILGVSSSFRILSLKKLQPLFKSFSHFKQYFDDNMDYQYIPCRHCDECRAKYAQEWSIRCYHEFCIRRVGCFLTLTIDSSKVSDFFSEKSMKRYCKRCVNGNRYIRYPIDYTLCHGLIQDWLKRFRDIIYKRYGIKVRYFGCGEYGEKDERPHYHILLFGYDFLDKKFFNTSSKGVKLYISEELSKLWNYGISTVQEINYQACMYTAKYVTKKLSFSNDIEELDKYYGREPEFLFMSKGNCQSNRCKYIDDIVTNCKGFKTLRDLSNPYCKYCSKTRGGLGFDWFKKYYRDVLQIGYITIEGVKYPIPKYYLNILKLTDKEMYDKYKLNQLNRIDDLDEQYPEEKSLERLTVRKKVRQGKLKAYHRA